MDISANLSTYVQNAVFKGEWTAGSIQQYLRQRDAYPDGFNNNKNS